MVRRVIRKARANGLIVIAVLQTEDYSCTPHQDGHLQKLPDQLTEEAWTQLLDPTLTRDRGVILEIFNEPNTSIACTAGRSWSDWATGCGRTDRGMATVGQYVRNLAPNNVLLFDGDNDAGEFTGFDVPPDMPDNSAYTVHPFFYDYGAVSNSEPHWNARFGHLQASGNTVVVTAWNESSNCPKDPHQLVTDALVNPEAGSGVRRHADRSVHSV